MSNTLLQCLWKGSWMQPALSKSIDHLDSTTKIEWTIGRCARMKSWIMGLTSPNKQTIKLYVNQKTRRRRMVNVILKIRLQMAHKKRIIMMMKTQMMITITLGIQLWDLEEIWIEEWWEWDTLLKYFSPKVDSISSVRKRGDRRKTGLWREIISR